MSKLLFIKLGGSLITDKRQPDSARPDVISSAARQVRRALSEDPDLRLVIGHGSGSFGHFAAGQVGFGYHQQADWRGYVEIGAAAARLNRIVADAFLAEGVPVFSLQPSATALARAGRLVRLSHQPLPQLLVHRLVPVVYGDVCLDDDFGWTIISTEQIFAYLNQELSPQRIVLAGEVAGVYADAQQTRLIPEISGHNIDAVRQSLSGAEGYDVTGGMFSKVQAMYDMVRATPGLEVHLISGLAPDRIHAALRGHPLDESTVIRA